ncbi:hypothetical protein FRC02_004483 [Tulasnella sp. 418]|nr:hypothetical protein FRC02_004483 [Tulasnella sp. 418]
MVPPAVRAVPLDLSRGGSDGAKMKRGDGGGAGTMTAVSINVVIIPSDGLLNPRDASLRAS